MQHKLDVKCPQCGRCAEFEFAEIRRIKLKADVDFFKSDSMFEYRQFQDSCGHYWHGALYYAGLHGDPRVALGKLPPGYEPGDWDHPPWRRGYGEDTGIGSVRCEHCHLGRKHILNWPGDAYYSVSYRNNVLWAFDRRSACDLCDFILSKTRSTGNPFLLRVPTVFKTHKAREAVSKHLLRLLAVTS